MTVSGTTAFDMSVAEIVTDAREYLGIQDEEEPLTDADLQRGIRVLNQMPLAWQADGVQTWVLTEGSFALAQGDYDYVFGSGGAFTTVPTEIMDVRITRNSQDLPMNRMSREEYQSLPVKSTEGYPTQWYYDFQRAGGTMYVWPAPDATGGTIKFTYRRQINDVGNGTNTLDLPKHWLLAVSSNLAVYLAPKYQVEVPAAVAAIASSSYDILKSYDTAEGKGSINIWPDDYA